MEFLIYIYSHTLGKEEVPIAAYFGPIMTSSLKWSVESKLAVDFPWPKDNVVSKDQLESAENNQKKSGAFNGNNKMMYLFFILGKSPSNFLVKIMYIYIYPPGDQEFQIKTGRWKWAFLFYLKIILHAKISAGIHKLIRKIINQK